MINRSLTYAIPDIWGEGALFGRSGLDGPSDSMSGFVATCGQRPFDFLIHTPRKRRLSIRLPQGFAVKIAGNELIAAETDRGDFVLAWSAWHTIVGWLPEGATAELSFARDPDTPSLEITEDRENGDCVGIMLNERRLVVSYAASVDDVRRRCEEGFAANLADIAARRLTSLHELPMLGSIDNDRLLRKCFSVMRVNTLAPEGVFGRMWSTPARVPCRHMWLWDTVFHALGMNFFHPNVSLDLLLSQLETAWTPAQAAEAGDTSRAGMISHCCGPDGFRSVYTQPPLLAWGMLETTGFVGDISRIAPAVGRIESYLQWDLDNRKAGDAGLLAWKPEHNAHYGCPESGMDNSPRFDTPSEAASPDFSSLAAWDMHCLGQLCKMVGETGRAGKWLKRSRAMASRVHELLWSEKAGLYGDRLPGADSVSPIQSIAGFFPLLLHDTPPERIDRLVQTLLSPSFNTAFPVPTVATGDSSFSADMWRGASWVTTNYILIRALEARGMKEPALMLREKTIAMVMKYYRKYGVIFEYFDATDTAPPPRCLKLGLPDEKPYLLGKLQVVRDYHPSAAITARLLMESR